MNSFKRSLIMVLSVGLIFSLLNGCSPAGERQKPVESTLGVTPKENGRKLTYYGFSEWVGDPRYSKAYEEAAARFQDEHPGFEVELQHDPWGTWEPKYKTMFVAGVAPDVFIVNNTDFPVMANNGYLLDIGEVTGPDYFRDFFPGVLPMYTWQDRYMGIPFTTDCRILWYNREIFKKVGLDPEKPPQTWEQLREYAEKCTVDTNGDGKTDVYGFGMDLGLKEFPQQAIFCASRGSIVKMGADGTIIPDVRTPEFTGYLKLLKDMVPFYEPDFVIYNHHKAGTLFTQQKVAMVIAGTWIWDMNSSMEKETFYGQALVPRMDGNSPEGSYGGGFGICVNRNTKHPEEAVKLAQLFCDPATNSRLMSDIPASRQGLANSPISKEARFSVFMKQIATARQAQPKTIFSAQINSDVYEVVTKVVLGEYSEEQGIKVLEDKIRQIGE